MRKLAISTETLTRGLRATVYSLLFAAMFSTPGIAAAVIVGSDFEGGDEGWLGHACVGAGLCSVGDFPWATGLRHVPTDGSPTPAPPNAGDRYIDLRDPGEIGGNDFAARLEPNPDTYLGAFTYGRTVTFDALIRTNGGGGDFDDSNDPDALIPGFVVAPLLAIETDSGTLVYITTDLPIIDGDWKHYLITLKEDPLDAPLVDGNGWLRITNALDIFDPNQEGSAAFQAALSTQTQTTVIAEWLSEGAEFETGGIDNFQVVPVPAALPLLASALFGLGYARRRRTFG